MTDYMIGCLTGIVFTSLIFLFIFGISYYLSNKDKPPNWINWDDEDF